MTAPDQPGYWTHTDAEIRNSTLQDRVVAAEMAADDRELVDEVPC